jgi:unsaturated rhamnogalacturonyl hydrolase
VKNFDCQEIIERIISRTMKMDLTWDWSCGVAYYGICRVYEVTGEQKVLVELKERVDELIDLGFEEDWTVNTCAMGHCLITLYEVFKDEQYLELLLSKVDYLENRALRFGDGALQHTVSNHDDFPEQAWADTLFMAAMFLLRMGILLNRQDLVEDALNQYYWHIRYLQNQTTGLFYHGYDHRQKSNLSACYWGRANAWCAYTMSQVKNRLPEAYLYPKFMDVQASLDEQLASLKAYQSEVGLWRTILDDDSSYEEVSASAGIAAGMVSNDNPLHRKYISRTLKGLLANVASDGRVENVSAGTAVMKTIPDYQAISRQWIQGWGQGLMLTFLAECLGNSHITNLLVENETQEEDKNECITSR